MEQRVPLRTRGASSYLPDQLWEERLPAPFIHTDPVPPYAATTSHRVAPAKKFPAEPVRAKKFRAGHVPTKMFSGQNRHGQQYFLPGPVRNNFFCPGLVRKLPPPSLASPGTAPALYTPVWEYGKSPAPPFTTERSRGQNPEKFGSGNGANAAGDSAFISRFPENNRFNRKKTVLFRSVRKCAKTGQPVVCPKVRCPPAAAIARNKGGPSGTGKSMFFS